MSDGATRIDMFFLAGERGRLLAVLDRPAAADKPAETVIVVPPFSEEMNRVRRVVALQGRRFARAGVAMLSLDLFGTGDSDGEFGEASWETWQRDLVTAIDWVRNHHGGRITLLGIRLGALLALEVAAGPGQRVDRVILWQPAIDGSKQMRDFMFIRVMAGMMQKSLQRTSIEQIRERLAADEVVEICGYDLAPGLFRSIDALKLDAIDVPSDLPVHWIEICQGEQIELKEDSLRIAAAWQAAGKQLSTIAVAGNGFWVDGKVEDIAALLDATAACLEPGR